MYYLRDLQTEFCFMHHFTLRTWIILELIDHNLIKALKIDTDNQMASFKWQEYDKIS